MTGRNLPRRAMLKGGAAMLGLAGCGAAAQQSLTEADLGAQLDAAAEPIPPIEADGFATFADRYANAQVVLLGESTHGTDEFYRARAAITERLVTEHGFNIIAVEADWPDAARIDSYIRGRAEMPSPITPFQRFPVWMWRNRAVRAFVDRLHEINLGIADPDRQAGFYGLDLYSLPSSMDAVVDFVARHDPAALEDVLQRYGCLAPYVDDPAAYGALARGPGFDTCTDEVVSVIEDVLQDRLNWTEASDLALFHALQNARVVAASEAYYRAMYEGSAASWNLRDTHMFETLQAVMAARGPGAKAVVWAHNSHIGTATATGMGERGEINIGQLCREAYGERAALIGFGTDRGTVTAASTWGGPTQTMEVRPSRPDAWGALMRQVGHERFFLDLRSPVAELLDKARLERFIGVIYRPETERVSHYVPAILSQQFDGYVWFDHTNAVEPLPAEELDAMPATYPFAL